MSAKPKSSRMQPTAAETSKAIAEQTEAFFKSGGKINYVKSGVSGQSIVAGPKHISLGKKGQAK
jgi:hypothetical protein